MLKKNMFIRLLILLFCFTLISTTSICFAVTEPGSPSEEEIIEETNGGGGDLSATWRAEVDSYNSGSGPYKTIQDIASVMLWLAIIIATFKIIQIGIKFLTGMGKGRQEAKAALIPWIIGLLVCLLFTTLGSTVVGLVAQGDSNIFG